MRDEATIFCVSTAIFAVVLLAFSWLYMQWTHETGHILAGLASGAEIDRVILDPRTFSMTQFHSTPHPQVAAWGGPLLGSMIGAGIPLLLMCVLRQWRFSLNIIAAFVLLANGLYLGLGAIYPVGDAHSLIKFGAPRWLLIAFGLICLLAGRGLLFFAFKPPIPWPRIWQVLVLCVVTLILAFLGLLVFPA